MMGMDSKVRSHVHTSNQVYKSRCFYNANVDVQPLFASKRDWFAWLQQANAWKTISHGISYAQVVNKPVNKDNVKCVQNSSSKTDSTFKPSTPVHVVKDVFQNDVRHRGHGHSHRIQHSSKISPIITKNRFSVLQDPIHSSDQKSPSHPSEVSDDRACNQQPNAHAVNHGIPVAHKTNTTSTTDQDCCGDSNKEYDSLEPHALVQKDTVFQSMETSIPQHVLENKHNCVDYLACLQDNKEGYGFIPVSPLQLYTGDPTYYQNIPDIIRLHRIVSQSGKPNYLGCRIPVKSQLKIPAWQKYLHTYWDQQIVDLL